MCLTLQQEFIVEKYSFLKAAYLAGLRAFARQSSDLFPFQFFFLYFFFSKNHEFGNSAMSVIQNQPLVISLLT